MKQIIFIYTVNEEEARTQKKMPVIGGKIIFGEKLSLATLTT